MGVKYESEEGLVLELLQFTQMGNGVVALADEIPGIA